MFISKLLSLVYQPVICAEDGNAKGVEMQEQADYLTSRQVHFL